MAIPMPICSQRMFILWRESYNLVSWVKHNLVSWVTEDALPSERDPIMPAEIIIFILTCLAVAAGLVLATLLVHPAPVGALAWTVAQRSEYRRQEKRTAIEAAEAAALSLG